MVNQENHQDMEMTTSECKELLAKLHTNQRLVASELVTRGATIEIIDLNIELLKVTYNNRSELLLDRFSDVAAFHVVKLSADKWRTKHLLRSAGISVPDGKLFTGEQHTEAVAHALFLNTPVVLKPNWGSHGDHVKTNLDTLDRIESAIWQFTAELGFNEPYIIERFHDWPEHRVFATKSGGFAVVRREPASVVGDGRNTLEMLIEMENYKRVEYRSNSPSSLCEIVIDDEVRRYLRARGLSMSYVPTAGIRVYLRDTSNLAKGGRALDETELAHSSIKQLALNVLAALPGLPCCGIDLLCNSVAEPLTPDNYVVIEVNSNPGLAMHVYPTVGQSRDVYKDMVDVMFPWIPRM